MPPETPDIHPTCPAPWGRLEDKFDRLDDKLDNVLERQAASDAACHERHRHLDVSFAASTVRVEKLEEAHAQAALARMSLLSGWRTIVFAGSVVLAVVGTIVGVLGLYWK